MWMSSPSRNRDRTTRLVIIAAAVLVLLFLCICCCGSGAVLGSLLVAEWGTPALEPTPSPSDFRPAPLSDTALDLAERVAGATTTNTSYWVLHGQLGDGKGEPAVRRPVQGATEYEVGDVHTFWMGDEEEQRYWQIDAELKIKTAHAYLYVSEGTSYDEDQLRRAADLFESQIYPTNHRYFGTEWTPGIDNDPRVTILVTDQMPTGIAGYFSTTDEYPRVMKPRSNQREMIYVTSSYLNSLDQFGQLLSHEFQHMIHWNQDFSESLWINEGLSLLAEEVNGYGSVLGIWQFWRNPDIQLTNWAEERGDRARNYAASKLFLSYFSEHYGGYEVLGKLAADDAYGVDGIDRLLQAEGYDADFVAVFADWLVANLVDDPAVGDGSYAYALRGSGGPSFSARLGRDTEVAGWVRQFGADYVEIDPGAGSRVVFEGSGLVRLVGSVPHAGQAAWWSGRRNMLNSSLTRRIDLSQARKATLRFWTWYDIEEDFDYGYVAVSTDEGRTWETLPGTHTTSDDPNESNYGHGYTGKSDVWLEEQVDLTPYAGREVLVRFWYISDPGLNQPGWLIDDISITEIGLSDDGEQQDHGWTVDGFIRSSNDVPQSYVVQLVEYGPQVTVYRLDLDAGNKAEVKLQEDTERAVLVVSGATRWTSELAPYRVQLKP